MNRLAQYCDRFIEVGWLAAIALVPLYINFFSSRGYSVGKAYLLRVIVLLMAGAWLMKVAEGGDGRGIRNPLAHLWQNPVAVSVAIYVAVFLLTTATSVAPGTSFYGLFERLQGGFTTLIYVSLFFLLALNLRKWEQFDRIITVLLLSSIPISLYAVAQELGWDPLVYVGPRETVRWRARSTLGNHVFLGAYLIMVMPWTAARMLEALSGRRQAGPGTGSSLRRALAGAASIAVQNMFLAAFLVAVASNRQIWWMALPVLTAYLFLVVWTSRLQPEAPPHLMTAAYGGLFLLQAVALALTQARGAWIAAFVGATVFGILMASRYGMRRLMAGVLTGGTLVALFVAVLNVPEGPLKSMKRYALFRRLGSLAAVGSSSIGYRLALWESVGRLMWNRPSVGGSPDPFGSARLFVGYGPETLGFTIESSMSIRLGPDTWRFMQDRAHNDFLQHLAESGLLGVISFLVLLVVFYRVTLKALWESAERAHQLSLIALITAVTAHLIELQFGLGVTVSRLLFWAFLALGMFLARPLPAEATWDAEETRSLWQSWMFPYAILTLVLVVAQSTPVKIERVGIGLLVGFSALLLGMLLLSLGLGALAGGQRPLWRTFWLHSIIAGVVGLLIFKGSFRPLLADAIFTSGEVPSQRQALRAYQEAATMEPREDTYYAHLGRLLMRLGLVLLSRQPDLKPPQEFQSSAVLARTLEPRRIFQSGGEGMLGLAEASFEEARRLQPLDPRHVFELARFNHRWGLLGREERLDRALGYYEEAARMTPSRLSVLLGFAMAHLAKNQPAQARELIHKAQSLGHDSWSLHYALALVHDRIGNRDLAEKEAEIVGRSGPAHAAKNLLEQLRDGKLRDEPLFETEGESRGPRPGGTPPDEGL